MNEPGFPRQSRSRVWIVFKKECLTFIFTPTIYVCFALFVFFANYFNFVFGHFFQKDEASLASSFFNWHPWLYAFFAPAISMRLWSEEYRQKTMELLLTMRFKPWQIVLGKFLASWLVLVVALLLTFPLVVTLYRLGPPDTGPVITGYLGSGLISGAFMAVAIAAASLSRNQFISYILGACLCSLLLVFGSVANMEAFIRMFANTSWLTNWIQTMNFTSQFQHFQKGIISASAIFYFFSTIVVGLLSAQLLISSNRK